MDIVDHLKRLVTSLFCLLVQFGIINQVSAQPATALGSPMAFQAIYRSGDDIAEKIGGVHAIAQDAHGFMWFGGESALARFDGWRSHLYLPDENDSNALIHGFVRRILFDHAGTMWLGTEKGLCQYLERSDSFDCRRVFAEGGTIPKVSTQALALDATNRLYVGAGDAVYSISADRQRLTKLPLSSSYSPDQAIGLVTDLAVDHRGVLWVATKDNGLFMYSPTTQVSKHFYFDSSRHLLNPFNIAHNNLKSLLVDDQNRLWIGSFGAGFSILCANRTDFQHYNKDEHAERGFANDVVWDIFQDRQNAVWLLLDQAGLIRFDEQNQRFIAYTHKPYDSQSLPTNQLRTIYEDGNGDLWLGNFPSGVTFHNRATREIHNFSHQPDQNTSISNSSVLSMVKDPSYGLWLGTEDGLNYFDPQRGTFKRFQQGDDIGLQAKAILSLAMRDKDSLWVGTWSEGLLIFDKQQQRFDSFFAQDDRASHIQNRFIWDILPLPQSKQLWLATEFNGANLVNTQSKIFQSYAPTNNPPFALPHEFVWDVMRDHAGAFWFATQAGIAAYDAKLQPIDLKRRWRDDQGLGDKDLVVALYEDQLHKLWVATYDRGVYVVDQNNNSVRHIGTGHGLPSQMAVGFIEDQSGEVWIATANGLARYDRITGNIQVLKKENGLSSNHFNRKAMSLDENGYLYFGGSNGLSVFHPEKVFSSVPRFSVKITGFRVFDEPLGIAEGARLTTNIVLAESVDLNYSDSMFSIDFAALNYRNTASTRYAYKLEGFDQAWNYVRDVPTATYTNLAPGRYQFQVRASRKNLWIESEPLNIQVSAPPWYSSRTSYLFVGLATLLVVFLVYFWQRRERSKLIQYAAHHDELSSLLNRSGLRHKLQNEYAQVKAGETNCIIILSFEKLKDINADYGYTYGDQVLLEVSNRIGQCLEPASIVARWSEDTFVVLCPGALLGKAEYLAQRICRKVAESPFTTPQQNIRLHLSSEVILLDDEVSLLDFFKNMEVRTPTVLA